RRIHARSPQGPMQLNNSLVAPQGPPLTWRAGRWGVLAGGLGGFFWFWGLWVGGVGFGGVGVVVVVGGLLGLVLWVGVGCLG
ncbi:hypothetical protein RA267_27540, partial [Pseudomonas syringae pv. tagetis]|uniref:hypothetical protein n=1 Tax=Pseudomonas syringae group genomosp. 7 TaxID=251699 RepID=UPI00376FF066